MTATHSSSRLYPDWMRGRCSIFIAIWGLLALATTSGCRSANKPVQVGVAGAQPMSIQFGSGSWYWIERRKSGDTRLMRAVGPTAQVVTSDDSLRCYAVEEGHVAWCARQDRRWTVTVAAADGSGRHSVWTGEDEPFGLCLSSGRAYWLHRVGAPIPDVDPFPPLSPTLEVLSAPIEGVKGVEGHEITSCARLRESEDGQVLGVHAGVIYIAAYRQTLPGCVCIYRKDPGSAPARRVAGMSGRPAALLTTAGALYLLSPSAETTTAYCLSRLDARGHLEALSDWLPLYGRLYETERGVVYADQESPPGLWLEGRHDLFPTRVPVPQGFFAIAAGGQEMLLARADTSFLSPTLYRMPLP